MFVYLKLALKKMDCNHVRITTSDNQFFNLDDVVDARPDDYKAKIQVSVVGEKEAWIYLSTEAEGDTRYIIGMIDIV